MPEPDGYFVSKRDWPDFQLLLAAFRNNGRRLTVPPAKEDRMDRSGRIRLAMTTAEHAAGATLAVNLCDTDFVERSPVESVDAINDSGVSIPDNTKILIQRITGKTRIIQAFICEG